MSSLLTFMIATVVTPFVPRFQAGGPPRGLPPPSLVDMARMSDNHSNGLPQLPATPPPLPREWLDTFSEPPTPAESPRKSSPVATLSAIDAVGVYLDAWLAELGESYEDLANLVTDYSRFRKTYPGLPALSEKSLSQCLVKHGCRRLKRDGRRKGQDGKRVTVIEIRRKAKVRPC